MKVLIVAKTRMQGVACVGGLALDTSRGLRLMKSNGGPQPRDTDYEVGQIWEMQYEPSPDIKPPHVEDVCVKERELVGCEPNLKEFLRKRVQPWQGPPSRIFDCLVRPTYEGHGYVNEIMGIPDCSTGFWLPDRPLHLHIDNNKAYYRYPLPKGTRGVQIIRYVGYAPTVEVIPAGTLVRLSLARWWKPQGASTEVEWRCYLQLSGWYL